MIVYVLTENEPKLGGAPVGAYSTPEKAKDAAAERPLSPDWFYYAIHPIKLDAPPDENIDLHSPFTGRRLPPGTERAPADRRRAAGWQPRPTPARDFRPSSQRRSAAQAPSSRHRQDRRSCHLSEQSPTLVSANTFGSSGAIAKLFTVEFLVASNA